MADTLTTTTTVSTIPSGTVIATDDAGAAGHVQIVKLGVATDGSATPIPTGEGVEANALRVTLGTDSDAILALGSLTESAPATDTASSGLNGRLQRIAQRLTSLIALLPASIGQKATTGSVSVTLSSDHGAVPVSDNSGSLTVDGTVTANLAAGTNAIGKLAANSGVDIGDVDVTSVAGNVTVVQATATNLKVDASGVAVPITDNSGSLTVDNGGTFAVQADTELTTADLDTGAGTDTRAVVGIVGSKSGGAQLIPGDATAGLKVDLGADNDVTVTGSVTANAGTNLNTSLLALEAGGNLAASAASLSVIDDWDETDRAKVNLIVGQAGVAAGSGVTGVTVQRVVLATDVGLPAGTSALGKVGHDNSTVGSGRKIVTTAATRVALASTTAAKWVVITAETDNTGLIVVGSAAGVIASLATREGTPLAAGDSMSLPIDDLADVGLDSTVSGDGVTYTYTT